MGEGFQHRGLNFMRSDCRQPSIGSNSSPVQIILRSRSSVKKPRTTSTGTRVPWIPYIPYWMAGSVVIRYSYLRQLDCGSGRLARSPPGGGPDMHQLPAIARSVNGDRKSHSRTAKATILIRRWRCSHSCAISRRRFISVVVRSPSTREARS